MSESIDMSHLDNLLILLDAAKKIGCKVNLRKSGVIVLVDGINALNKRIAELEYKASDNASSIHAIISVLDVNDETQGFSEDMYDTTLGLAHKLRTRVAELEAENAGLKERVAMLDVTAVFKSLGEMGYIEQVTKLRQLLTDFESQLCWIPVSERLPELDQDVFAIVEGDIDKGHFYESFDGEIYFSSDTRGAMLVATHWMYVPDLPEEVQE